MKTGFFTNQQAAIIIRAKAKAFAEHLNTPDATPRDKAKYWGMEYAAGALEALTDSTVRDAEK